MIRKKWVVCLAAAGLLAAICALAPADDQTVTPRKGTVGTEADGQVDAPAGADTSAADNITPVEGQPKVKIITRLFKLPSGWSFKKFLTKVAGQKSLWVDVIPGEVDGYPLEVPTAGAGAIRVNRVFDEGVTNAGGFPLQLEGNLQPPSGKGKPQDFYWAVKVAPMVAIQEIQGNPNNNLALNNTFIKQEGTVGVLKGFKVKYIGIVNSPASGDTYTWQYRGHDGQSAPADWTNFGTGLTVISDENTVGDYDVRLKLSRGGQDYYSDTRRVMVADVEFVKMVLTDSGWYTRVGTTHKINRPPAGQEFSAVGQIKFKAGSPQPTNIRQGFIQGIIPAWDARHDDDTLLSVQWKPGVPQGATETYPGDEINQRVNPPQVNDAPLGHYLYGLSVSQALGSDFEVKDAPLASNSITYPHSRPLALIIVKYDITRNIMEHDFQLWLVAVVGTAVENKAHYVPFKQQAWQLHIDSTDMQVNQWKGQKIGNPAEPSTKPTDGSQTTADTYNQTSGWGDWKTVTKP